MKFIFILFFLLLNFIIFRFIQRNETIKSKIILILSLLVFNIVFTKSYKFLYYKFADYLLIKPFGIFVLLSFSCLIPIIVYLNNITSQGIISKLMDFEKDGYLKTITIIITFMQIVFLWSGIVNVFKHKDNNLKTDEKQKTEISKLECEKTKT